MKIFVIFLLFTLRLRYPFDGTYYIGVKSKQDVPSYLQFNELTNFEVTIL